MQQKDDAAPLVYPTDFTDEQPTRLETAKATLDQAIGAARHLWEKATGGTPEQKQFRAWQATDLDDNVPYIPNEKPQRQPKGIMRPR